MSSSSFFNLQLNISINIEELQGLKSYLNNITKNNNNPNEYSIKLHTLEIRLNEESKKNTKAQENTKKLISYDQIIYKILEDFTFISKFRENILKSYNQKKGKLIANYDQNKSYILQIYHNDDNDPLYSFEIIENKEPKQASIQYLYANYVKFLKEKILSILKKFTNESDSILISNLDELYKELGGQDIPNNVEDKKNYSGQIENNIKNIPQKKTKIIKISEPGIDDEGRTNVSFEIDQSNSHKQKSKEINNIENDSQHRTNHKSFGITSPNQTDNNIRDLEKKDNSKLNIELFRKYVAETNKILKPKNKKIILSSLEQASRHIHAVYDDLLSKSNLESYILIHANNSDFAAIINFPETNQVQIIASNSQEYRSEIRTLKTLIPSNMIIQVQDIQFSCHDSLEKCYELVEKYIMLSHQFDKKEPSSVVSDIHDIIRDRLIKPA